MVWVVELDYFEMVESVRDRLTRLRLLTRTERAVPDDLERSRLGLLEKALEKVEEALERLETGSVVVEWTDGTPHGRSTSEPAGRSPAGDRPEAGRRPD